MKKLLTTFSTLALLLSLVPATAESDSKKRDRPDWSPEIRERFHAARMKALEDPEIQELRKEAKAANQKFFRAMREKMSAIDPGLAEIVRKKWQEKKGHRGRKFEGKNPKRGEASGSKARPDRRHPRPAGLGSLDENERQTLKQARKKAQSEPEVQAALEQKKAAKTPQEREAASAAYRQSMHDAMLKADPSMEPILKKIAPKGKPAPKKGSENDGEMMD